MTDEERQALDARARAYTSPSCEVIRVKIVLLAAEGLRNWNHRRPWRGRVARDQPVAPATSKRVVVDLRLVRRNLAVWGWAERSTRRLLFPGDMPRLVRPLPQALAPQVDRDLMAAVAGLDDLFAAAG